jgi:RNA polymerase sigma-32 factor
MQAVKRFKSDLGYRLSTYAVWWIKASIQEYILRSWSLVKMGTTAAQKKLFFNLNKIKKKLYNGENRNLAPEDCETIANELNVTNKEVQEMEMRLVGADLSLNKSLSDESGDEIIDLLPETRANQETMMARSQEMQQRKSLLNSAMATLNEREKHIFSERRLKEEPTTLEILSQTLGISRERVRQIEARVFEKLQNAMVNAS